MAFKFFVKNNKDQNEWGLFNLGLIVVGPGLGQPLAHKDGLGQFT